VRLQALGRSGTLVSEFCLGTMTFGTETDEPEGHRILDEYVEAGGNFIDTADPYSDGLSEQIVGNWIARRGRSDDLVIATKVFFPMGDDPNEQGLSARWIKREIENSLRRLRLDHVDLYQAHCWDSLTPLEETLAAFDDLVHAGKVRYLGVSNFMGWQLQRAALLTRIHGWAPITTLQPQYNLLAREIEWELVPVCLEEGIGLLPWSPLGGGWLTGKYRPDERPTGATRLGEDPERGVEAYDKRNVERTWKILEVVEWIARERGSDATYAQVALNWLRRRPAMTSVVLGVRNVAQLRGNLGALVWELSDEEARALDEVSDPGSPYPKAFIDDETKRRREELNR
jgi:aryl-alcohol dehydrogenase-like predicted oxidoreductase